MGLSSSRRDKKGAEINFQRVVGVVTLTVLAGVEIDCISVVDWWLPLLTASLIYTITRLVQLLY